MFYLLINGKKCYYLNMLNKQLGSKGEEIITKYCKDSLGFEIIDRNYKCGKFGELDIIAKKDDLLIFVEVKARSSSSFMNIYEQVDKRKIKALARAIKYYIMKNNLKNAPFRLDLATYNEATKKIKYYKNIYTE